MTPRHLAATFLFVVALGLVAVAALTPIHAADVAELDAQAQRLGEQWVSATAGLDVDSEEADRLLRESNTAYAAARDLEPPLGPIRSVGFALLAIAGGVALWPGRPAVAEDANAER